MWLSRRGVRPESPEKEDSEYSDWQAAPDLVLIAVFRMLNMRQRYSASLVCSSWARIFRLPDVWRCFVLDDGVFTKNKYNYHYGWQRTLDHIRASMALEKMARHIRVLVIQPMSNFFNMFAFMNLMSMFAARYPGSLDGLHSLRTSQSTTTEPSVLCCVN